MSTKTPDASVAPGDTLTTVPRPSRLTRVRDVGVTRVLPPLLTFGLILGLTELVSRSGILPSVVTPSPFTTLETMVQQAFGDILWHHLRITLQEGVLGFLIGSAIGFTIGVGIGVSALISRAVYPFVVLVQSMPRVALAPVFIALLGFGQSAKVLTAVAICFFPVLLNTIVGLRNVDPDALLLMRSLQATRMQTFRKLLLPGAMPMVFGGLKTSMTFALLGAIVGELTAANEGIGSLIEIAAFQLRMPSVFSYILWMSVVSLAIFGAMELLERRIVFWKEDPRKVRLTEQE